MRRQVVKVVSAMESCRGRTPGPPPFPTPLQEHENLNEFGEVKVKEMGIGGLPRFLDG